MLFRTFPALNESLRIVTPNISENNGAVLISLEELSPALQWKSQPLDLTRFNDRIQTLQSICSGVEIEPLKIRVPSKLHTHILGQIEKILVDWFELIARENPDHPEIWGLPGSVTPSGFDEKANPASAAWLERIYQSGLIVKEKKNLVIDLAKSSSAYLVSVGPERKSIIDGASQIASLALGYNDPIKNAMALRPELQDPSFNVKDWDVTEAFRHLLRRKSKLPHVYFVNSGSEAIEAGFRSCQTRYPSRKKIVAFDGSFHGRTLLSLHCTHSPSKRLPFEIYPELINYIPYPETKDPDQSAPEPSPWIELWQEKDSKRFDELFSEIHQKADILLQNELASLKKVREKIELSDHLAVIIEPMQCEGGDRYGTSRFYRGLRILTRTFDTPLVFDEVQTGFSLGNRFFWHESFDLPEPPDVVCTAKKAQVGVCMSRFVQELETETSPASLYRGYLHALSALEFKPEALAEKIRKFLDSLHESLGENLVQAPRNQGLAFAFDLPDKKILDALITYRFQNGLLFYPAGDRTARFRVLYTTTEREITQIFSAIYKCFIDLSERDLIGKIPTYEEWVDTLPAAFQKWCEEKPNITLEAPLHGEMVPKTFEQYEKLSKREWRNIFRRILKHYPQYLRHPVTLETDLLTLNKFKKEDFWNHYNSSEDFSRMDLLWQSSRAFGHTICRLDLKQVTSYADQIAALQEKAYEPERRDPSDTYLKLAQDPRCIFLACLDESERLIGMTAAAPLKHFKYIELVSTDYLLQSPDVLYSHDVTVDPTHQGEGIGLRLKCEQTIEALRAGVTVIRSRNRYPEAKSMMKINRSLGAVTIGRNDQDYDGKSTAFYQSFRLGDGRQEFRILDPLLPALKNKSTLSNFVSTTFVNGLDLIRDLFPTTHQHFYVASSRAEALDKMVKLLRKKRPKGDYCLSFQGDRFGETTAAARSLGSASGPVFFNWPVIAYNENNSTFEEIEKVLKERGSERLLGLFVEPFSIRRKHRKSEKFLKELLDFCQKKEILVIFQETDSAFGRYQPGRFFCLSPEIQPNGIYLHLGGQTALCAADEQLFLADPLQLISTWDGDEHSLNLFKQQVLDWKAQ